MKKYVLMLLLCTVLFPVNAFALFNAEIYGGYSLGGEIEDLNAQSVGGIGYGFRGHLYQEYALFGFGGGLFVQHSILSGDIKADGLNTDLDFNKTSYGLDCFVNLDLPILPIHPYVRGGISIYDTTTSKFKAADGSKQSKTSDDYFQSYYGGLGTSVSVLGLFHVFGEYLYEYSSPAADSDYKGHRFNLGALVRM